MEETLCLSWQKHCWPIHLPSVPRAKIGNWFSWEEKNRQACMFPYSFPSPRSGYGGLANHIFHPLKLIVAKRGERQGGGLTKSWKACLFQKLVTLPSPLEKCRRKISWELAWQKEGEPARFLLQNFSRVTSTYLYLGWVFNSAIGRIIAAVRGGKNKLHMWRPDATWKACMSEIE